MPKQPHDFHLRMRDKHISELEQNGKTICNSPYIRLLIYEELKRRGLQFTSTVVGWGAIHGASASVRNHKWTYHYNPKAVMQNLIKGRLDKQWVLKFYDQERFPETIGATRNEIESLFDCKVLYEKKVEIINKVCKTAKEWCVKRFIFHDACKTINEITIIK